MADQPLPPGAELVDGSIRMQAAADAGQCVQRLAGRVFNEQETRAVNQFVEGALSLVQTVSNHLSRFADEVVHRLVIRIWMRSRFGEELNESIDQKLAEIEKEEKDPTAVFIRFYHELEATRKHTLKLDVRRPTRANRSMIRVKQLGGGRVYTADTAGATMQPTQHAAVDKRDTILSREIERFGRLPGMPDAQTASAIAEQFLLGTQTFEDTIKRLRGLSMSDRSGKRMSTELKELIAVSNAATAWMVVAFDLEWTPVLLYVRKWLTVQKRSEPDVFYELYKKFSGVADVEEEHELHHSTVNRLIQVAFQQIDPPADAESVVDLSKIDWLRYDEESVPESQREKIAAEIKKAIAVET